MSSSNCLKRFLHNHSHLVDFLSASLIICLCLIVLLPKVHESFQGHQYQPSNSNQLPQPGAQESGPSITGGGGGEVNSSSIGELPAISSTLATTTIGTISISPNLNGDNVVIQEDTEPIAPPDSDPGHHHQHNHSHKIPIGEVLICVGFFVFYCLGLGITRLNAKEREPLMMAERKISTVCCSSTRCPSSQNQEIIVCNGVIGVTGANLVLGTTTTMNQMARSRSQHGTEIESEQLLLEHERNQQEEDDCVLLLNRHHNHHTHVRHHEHPPPSNLKKRPIINDYGSTSRVNGLISDPDPMGQIQDNISDNSKRPRPNTMHVEEISITREIRNADADDIYLSWPLSIKVTIFSLLIAAFLVIFDLNIHGLMQSIKVFRAAATGALLYLAFFIILPKDSAGCNSCTEEEI